MLHSVGELNGNSIGIFKRTHTHTIESRIFNPEVIRMKYSVTIVFYVKMKIAEKEPVKEPTNQNK